MPWNLAQDFRFPIFQSKCDNENEKQDARLQQRFFPPSYFAKGAF